MYNKISGISLHTNDAFFSRGIAAFGGNMKRSFSILICLALALSPCALAEKLPQTPMPTLSSGALDMLAVDHKLYELGYRDSACMGVLNDVMINALGNFQQANGLEITGEPDTDTVSLLMSGTALSQQAYISSLAYSQNQKRILADGDHGDDVRELQRRLKLLGYFSGSIDGAYGHATQEAVFRFQLANGLKETGIADRSVQLRLYCDEPVWWEDFLEESCASAGESGAHVRRIQLWLKHKNHFFGACTGRYGDGTQQAVKRFQAANGLESSGDVDMDTCIALFSDVGGMLADVQAVRRGESGSDVEGLHQALNALGYPTQAQFNMQTELAVMQFQYVNGLEVTGIADGEMLSLLTVGSPREAGSELAAQEALQPNGEQQAQLSRRALSLLGQQSGFVDSFDFVSYVFLKCGMPLLEREQLQMELISDRSRLHSGQVICLHANGAEIWGIATSDGAIISRDENGYIVMRYLNMMQFDAVYGSADGGEVSL